MNWIVIYLAIGTLVLLGFSVDARLREQSRRDSDWTEIRNLILNKRQSRISRFLHKYLLPAITAVFVLLVWPAATAFAVYFYRSARKDRMPTAAEPPREFSVTLKDLGRSISRDEIESSEMVCDPLTAVPPLPFGFLNKSWQRISEIAQDGDKFWTFETPWGRNGVATEFRLGYALVRNGEVVSWFVKSIKRERNQ